MINYKESIKKLHKEFPTFDADTLLKIMDCYTDCVPLIPSVFKKEDYDLNKSEED